MPCGWRGSPRRSTGCINFEEYSLPVMGFDYSIQEMVCGQFGFAPYPECPIPMRSTRW